MSEMVLNTQILRKRLGKLSQAAFAEIAHVDQSSVSLWETNKNAPSRAAAAWILQHCNAKNVAPKWKPAPLKRARSA